MKTAKSPIRKEAQELTEKKLKPDKGDLCVTPCVGGLQPDKLGDKAYFYTTRPNKRGCTRVDRKQLKAR